MNRTYYLSGSLTGTHKEFVDRQTNNIKNRLKEVYGEVLPEELDKQIGYIVSGKVSYKLVKDFKKQWRNECEKDNFINTHCPDDDRV